jgi:spermidine synthase
VVVEIRADPARRGGRLVLQDGVESSYVDIMDPTHLEFEYLRHLARVVDAVHPKRRPMAMVQVGGGPCALPRYLDATRKELRALVIERDPAIIDIAREWLGLRTSPRLAVRIADGRDAVADMPDASLDAVVIDAFDGVIVPHHLVTREFTADVRRVLRPGGVHVVNLIDIPPLGFAGGVVATLAQGYRSVMALSDPATMQRRSSGNIVVTASDRAIPFERIARVARLDPDPWDAAWGRRLDDLIAGAEPLADDIAPDHALAALGPLWGRSRDARMGRER